MTEVAKAYGGALYELSMENGNTEDILNQLIVLKDGFTENPQFAKLLNAPNLKKQERLEILDNSFKDKIDISILNFMKILVENSYINYFCECATEFRNRYNTDNNIIDVTAVTAITLSDELMQKLCTKLETVTGKKVSITNKVDTKIIAGIELQMEGVQLESSVKSKIDAIRKSLLNLTAY